MKNVISFSLFGNNEIYTFGAIRNAEIHKKIFSEWEMRVYHDNSVPKEILDSLISLNVVLIPTTLPQEIGRFWRFLPASDDDVNYFISRDCDSRISLRDEVAVNEWIESSKNFHIIREHPVGHTWYMNAGMWGCKGGIIKNIEDKIIEFYNSVPNKTNIHNDQHFLAQIIYPLTVNDCLIHDEFCNYPNEIKTHIKRDRNLDNFAFIGESVDKNDIPRGDQRTSIRQKYK